MQALSKKQFGFETLVAADVLAGKINAVCGPDGGGKTEVVLQVLEKSQPKTTPLLAAWIEEEIDFYPLRLLETKIPLDQVLFINAGKNLFRCAFQALRSGLFQYVVLSREVFSGLELRKLQLDAQRSPSRLFLLSKKPCQESWSLSSQLWVQRDPEVKIEVLKSRKAGMLS